MDLPDDLHDADRLLREARPLPDEAFVETTERRLLGRPARARRRRTLGAAIGLSAALSAAVVIAALAGAGPLFDEDDEAAKAKQRCVTVQVTRLETVRELVEGADGEPRVIERRRPVTRDVKRCR